MACSLPTAPATDPQVCHAWHAKRWLGRARMLNAPLCLLLIILTPKVPRPLIITLALALAAGDIGVLTLLSAVPHWPKLRVARALATATEWAGGLGVVALYAATPTAPVPALLLVALVLTAGRYGSRGLLVGSAAAWLALLALATAQVFLLGVRDLGAAGRAVLGWGILTGATAIAMGGVLALTNRGEWVPAIATPPPTPPAPLSPREAAVLPLLAREELSYAQIGAALYISDETVRTHVRRIGKKLGAATGRRAVVAAARARGLLPPANDGPTEIVPVQDVPPRR